MQTLEERVSKLEGQLEQLLGDRDQKKINNDWVNKIFGRFKDDPLYDEAMREGAEYRKSQVPEYMHGDDVSA